MKSSPPGIHDEPLFSKQTSLMALILASIAVGGFFMVAISLKLNGYPSNHVNWRIIPVFIRHHGLLLLCIPVFWTIIAVIAQRRDRGRFYSGVYWSGVYIAVSLFLACFIAAYDPFTRPIFRRIAQPPAQNTAQTP